VEVELREETERACGRRRRSRMEEEEVEEKSSTTLVCASGYLKVEARKGGKKHVEDE